jgi:outer membrane beta-barrel protein
MRTIKHGTRSLLIVALGVALASTSFADNKNKNKGGGAGGAAGGTAAGGGSADEGIEIDQPAGSDSGTIDMEAPEEQEKPAGSLEAELNANEANQATVKAGPVRKTPLSWKDILVVVRKPFLKVRRTELNPFTSITMNDNMITHYTLGGEFAYYLTDVLAVGVEGQYYVHQFAEPFDLVARQARRLPTVNQYNWSAALNFHYVPVYGKFAVLDHRLVAWEVFFTAGVGAGQSEVIPRDTKFPGFTNILIQPNLGASMRFFIAKWLTVNLGVRDYMFIDKFEPTDRSPTMNATATDAKENADSAFINNIMFQIGVSFWLPTTFEYTTFR